MGSLIMTDRSGYYMVLVSVSYMIVTKIASAGTHPCSLSTSMVKPGSKTWAGPGKCRENTSASMDR